MAQDYDNTNSGILTKNNKDGVETRPDYRGSLNVNGEEFWLSAWLKDGREGTKLAGQKYMSLSIQPKEAQAQKPSSSQAPNDDNSDIPF